MNESESINTDELKKIRLSSFKEKKKQPTETTTNRPINELMIDISLKIISLNYLQNLMATEDQMYG